MSKRPLKPGLMAVMVVAFTVMVAGPAAAVITPTSSASDIADATASDSVNVTGASFDALPPQGTPNAVSDTPLAGFPTNGGTYGILTTGDATLADNPDNAPDSGTDDGGGNVRGDTDFDVTVLRVDFNVPEGANCLSLDFRFLSEEFPEFVGSEFNDAFIAELDETTWTTSGSTISAPNNFAFDSNGNVISVNSTGVANVSEAAAAGTTYDAATQLLQARTQVTPGSHSLYLSIFDQGDNIFDSATFVDNVSVFDGTANCQEGAQMPSPTPGDGDEQPGGGGIDLGNIGSGILQGGNAATTQYQDVSSQATGGDANVNQTQNNVAVGGDSSGNTQTGTATGGDATSTATGNQTGTTQGGDGLPSTVDAEAILDSLNNTVP